MRTRTKNNIIAQHAFSGGTYISTLMPQGTAVGGYTTLGPKVILLEREREQMLDIVSKKSERTENPVFHRKTRFLANPDGISGWPHNIQTQAPWGYAQMSAGGPSPISDPFGLMCDYLDRSADVQWDIQNPLAVCPPRMSVTYPSINEVVILQDLMDKAYNVHADMLVNLLDNPQQSPLQVIKLLVGAVSLIKSHKARESALKYLAWKGAISAKRYAKGVANLHLAWKFGIEPIIQDTSVVIDYAKGIRNGLDKARDNPYLTVNRRYQGKATFDSANYGTATINGYNVAGSYDIFRPINWPSVNYQLKLKLTNQYTTGFFKDLDSMLRTWTTGPASTAWELIPFSFVLDWFVDTRSVLRKIDEIAGANPYTVESFTRSNSWETNVDTYTYRGESRGGGRLYEHRSARSYHKSYSRVVLPASTKLVWKPRFGKNQLALSASLITQLFTRAK